ncbi:MAG: response regulator transcription factor [Bacteroidota bacterium]
MTTRVFIVDDHELMREGLKTVLENHSRIKVSGEAGSFKEFTSSFHNGSADVIVLDISLPDQNGLEVLKYIRDNHPSAAVLILSMHPEERFALRALKGGALGYLNKQTAGKELVKAIETVRRGEVFVSAEVAGALVRELGGNQKKKPHEMLNDREFEVFRLIAGGKTAREIGKDINLSIHTVTTYRSRILKKMNAKNTADLVRYAMEHRIID